MVVGPEHPRCRLLTKATSCDAANWFVVRPSYQKPPVLPRSVSRIHRGRDSRRFYAIRAIAGPRYELVAWQLGHADAAMGAAVRDADRRRWRDVCIACGLVLRFRGSLRRPRERYAAEAPGVV